MPAIAQIGSIVTVTPAEPVQVVYGPGKHEFVDDQSPFVLRVSGILKDNDKIVGVHGDVISGHERYRGLIATLLIRLTNSDWTRDNHSAAQFKVGQGQARLNGEHPYYHPEGTDIDGFPVVIRYGSIDSRGQNESLVNSAMESSRNSQAETDSSNGNQPT